MLYFLSNGYYLLQRFKTEIVTFSLTPLLMYPIWHTFSCNKLLHAALHPPALRFSLSYNVPCVCMLQSFRPCI